MLASRRWKHCSDQASEQGSEQIRMARRDLAEAKQWAQGEQKIKWANEQRSCWQIRMRADEPAYDQDDFEQFLPSVRRSDLSVEGSPSLDFGF